MPHYVLVYRGESPRKADLELIAHATDVRIVDETAARAMLVDASETAAQRLREQLQDWLVAEETTHPAPGPATEEPRQAPE
jgi:hypothetical protein